MANHRKTLGAITRCTCPNCPENILCPSSYPIDKIMDCLSGHIHKFEQRHKEMEETIDLVSDALESSNMIREDMEDLVKGKLYRLRPSISR